MAVQRHSSLALSLSCGQDFTLLLAGDAQPRLRQALDLNVVAHLGHVLKLERVQVRDRHAVEPHAIAAPPNTLVPFFEAGCANTESTEPDHEVV